MEEVEQEARHWSSMKSEDVQARMIYCGGLESFGNVGFGFQVFGMGYVRFCRSMVYGFGRVYLRP